MVMSGLNRRELPREIAKSYELQPAGRAAGIAVKIDLQVDMNLHLLFALQGSGGMGLWSFAPLIFILAFFISC